MLSDISELLRCKKIIEQKLDWGESENWQSTDFENLNQLILDETGISLSISTLRRIWGRVEYNHLPSVTTLNTLAKFAGYNDWRSFVKQYVISNLNQPEISFETDRKITIPGKKLAWISGAVLLIGLISILAFQNTRQTQKENYTFNSQPITREIPNSVIFTYDASDSPTDSVFIQQSWDGRKRTLVGKNLHKHTSIYYEPGFYIAKLIVGEKVVKEHKLLVPTKGWLGTIDGKKIPVYLKDAEFIKPDILRLPVSVITEKNISMQPEPPYVHYFNVGNFESVSLKNFSFNTEIKHEYREGAAACQMASITLLTDDIPIVIPLSVKGCVSELNMLSIDNYISGKKADLSAFGVDFSIWNKVSCKNTGEKIQYFVNNKLAAEYPLPKREIKIVGISYTFQGTGAVKNVSLSSGNKIVFEAFNNKIILSAK
ncbi:hypothetical protein [Dyadobacter frigoris]|uniref:Uncharacterized protein n=1 Tax=Dyadobacter frigoris TaxID=2576211 RepID=A0A4U6D650_9BACT|nr:hypothetical protein [Dyadobacter frigoris]TKT92812.1 hypothetical protein FDK13_08415 [Dyadobacter frigoris]GLU54427.1 hypothetical protein Dfri01_38880 [Dyadobacter frigoris]